MTTITQVAGRYLYEAEVIAKGTRNPRRVLLHAPMLFELPTATAADIVSDALVVEPSGDGEGRISHSAFGGLLYRPAETAAGEAMSLDRYAGLLAGWPTMADEIPSASHWRDSKVRSGIGTWSDPIFNSRSHEDRWRWPDRKDPRSSDKRFEVHAEETFEGRVLKSAAGRTAVRLAEAARQVLVVDGEVHYRAVEPTWWVTKDQIRLDVRVPEFDPWYHYVPSVGSEDTFGIDRLEDALAWHVERFGGAAPQVSGAVLARKEGLRVEPAMARPVQAMLRYVLSVADETRDHLGPEAFAAWGRLRAAAATLTPFDLGALKEDPSPVMDDMAAIVRELDGRFLPPMAQGTAGLAKHNLETLERRRAFEAAIGPAQAARPADDEAAFAAMASP